MYFTKSFRVVMSDLYLAYCVPQGDLGLLCCAHGTELLSRSTSLVLKQTKNKQLLKSESTPVALLRRPSSLWRSQRCLTPTEMSPRHTHTPALAILSHEVELKQGCAWVSEGTAEPLCMSVLESFYLSWKEMPTWAKSLGPLLSADNMSSWCRVEENLSNGVSSNVNGVTRVKTNFLPHAPTPPRGHVLFLPCNCRRIKVAATFQIPDNPFLYTFCLLPKLPVL